MNQLKILAHLKKEILKKLRVFKTIVLNSSAHENIRTLETFHRHALRKLQLAETFTSTNDKTSFNRFLGRNATTWGYECCHHILQVLLQRLRRLLSFTLLLIFFSAVLPDNFQPLLPSVSSLHCVKSYPQSFSSVSFHLARRLASIASH